MASITIDRNGFLANVFLARKGPCRAATTAAITLSGPQTIDGVAVEAEQRVLVKDQASGIDNGVYIVKSSTWVRAGDFNRRGHATKGTTVRITDGTTNALTEWMVSTEGDPVPGQEAISFLRLFSADLAGLTPANDTIIVGTGTTWVTKSGDTARTSLGLGTGDTPQFTAVNIGATDTTITRTGAGDIAVEGNGVYRAGGTDVPVADGGSGRSSATAFAVICGGSTSTGAHQSIAGVGSAGQVLTSNGAGALPTFQSAGSAASQAQVEAASDITTFVSPGRQHFHPGHPKAWGRIVGSTGALVSGSYGVTSTSRISTGLYEVTLATAMSSTDYMPMALGFRVANGPYMAVDSIISTSVFRIVARIITTDAAIDVDCGFVVFGDHT